MFSIDQYALKVLTGVFVLGILILVHELGHFLLAKLNGVGVLEFSIGFGRKIVQWRRRGTRYSIGIIPLGGYVRMVGDDPHDLYETETLSERVLEAADPVDDEEAQALIRDKQCWFLERGFFVKAAVVLAGPGFNYLFAILLAIVTIFAYGKNEPLPDPVIGEVVADLPAAKAGLRPGDRVVSIDGKPVESWKKLARTVQRSGGQPMSIEIQRPENGELKPVKLSVTGLPENPELALVTGTKPRDVYVIGIHPSSTSVPVSIGEAAERGVGYVWGMTVMSIRSFRLLVTGAISAKNIGGPIQIMKFAAQSAEKGLERLAHLIAFLSVSLAILNLLPIPILDGGHLVFFSIEALKGSPINLRAQEIANQVGLVLLLALMVFAVGNDVVRLFE